MTDESRAFLEENCPAVLQADNLSEALDILFDDIEEKGFGGNTLMNTVAMAAQLSEYMMIFISPIRRGPPYEQSHVNQTE